MNKDIEWLKEELLKELMRFNDIPSDMANWRRNEKIGGV